MILVGAGGLAKSRSVAPCWARQGLLDRGQRHPVWHVRQALPAQRRVRRDRRRGRIYADRSGVRLLKCLCQTEEEKAVAWHSDARSLERHHIRREFTTKSRVAIISNDWQTLSKNVAAVQDRGHVLLFQPSASEVHARAGSGSTTRRSMGGSPRISTACASPRLATTYGPGNKAAGMDWTAVLAAEDENPRHTGG